MRGMVAYTYNLETEAGGNSRFLDSFSQTKPT